MESQIDMETYEMKTLPFENKYNRHFKFNGSADYTDLYKKIENCLATIIDHLFLISYGKVYNNLNKYLENYSTCIAGGKAMNNYVLNNYSFDFDIEIYNTLNNYDIGSVQELSQDSSQESTDKLITELILYEIISTLNKYPTYKLFIYNVLKNNEIVTENEKSFYLEDQLIYRGIREDNDDNCTQLFIKLRIDRNIFYNRDSGSINVSEIPTYVELNYQFLDLAFELDFDMPLNKLFVQKSLFNNYNYIHIFLILFNLLRYHNCIKRTGIHTSRQLKLQKLVDRINTLANVNSYKTSFMALEDTSNFDTIITKMIENMNITGDTGLTFDINISGDNKLFIIKENETTLLDILTTFKSNLTREIIENNVHNSVLIPSQVLELMKNADQLFYKLNDTNDIDLIHQFLTDIFNKHDNEKNIKKYTSQFSTECEIPNISTYINCFIISVMYGFQNMKKYISDLYKNTLDEENRVSNDSLEKETENPVEVIPDDSMVVPYNYHDTREFDDQFYYHESFYGILNELVVRIERTFNDIMTDEKYINFLNDRVQDNVVLFRIDSFVCFDDGNGKMFDVNHIDNEDIICLPSYWSCSFCNNFENSSFIKENSILFVIISKSPHSFLIVDNTSENEAEHEVLFDVGTKLKVTSSNYTYIYDETIHCNREIKTIYLEHIDKPKITPRKEFDVDSFFKKDDDDDGPPDKKRRISAMGGSIHTYTTLPSNIIPTSIDSKQQLDVNKQITQPSNITPTLVDSKQLVIENIDNSHKKTIYNLNNGSSYGFMKYLRDNNYKNSSILLESIYCSKTKNIRKIPYHMSEEEKAMEFYDFFNELYNKKIIENNNKLLMDDNKKDLYQMKGGKDNDKYYYKYMKYKLKYNNLKKSLH